MVRIIHSLTACHDRTPASLPYHRSLAVSKPVPMLTDSACSRPADLAAYVTCQGKTYRCAAEAAGLRRPPVTLVAPARRRRGRGSAGSSCSALCMRHSRVAGAARARLPCMILHFLILQMAGPRRLLYTSSLLPPPRRLPGPLALVQTEGSGAHCVTTHVNDLSLADIAATCPEATAEELAAGGCLTCVSRGGVTVQGLTVVAVHAGLLVPAAAEAGGDGEAQQQRALMRAAARLTWGLAGLVFELMHCQAGHWPSLASPTRRQEVAGAALTQLYR